MAENQEDAIRQLRFMSPNMVDVIEIKEEVPHSKNWGKIPKGWRN